MQISQSQSTDALLKDLFQDIISQQQSQYRGQVALKAVGSDSRGTGESSETDSKIAKACEYYRHCVEELAAVERHLLQAKARALTEREKKLSEKKQALCGYDETINLPTEEESPLGSLLDRELLEKNHLLHPTHYTHPSLHPPPLSTSHTHTALPTRLKPTYLQPTFTSTQHTSISKPTHTSPVQQQFHPKPPWKDQPTLSEREADRKALAQLKKRGDYLCNPRYSSQPQPNTSSHGALRKRERVGRTEKMRQVDTASTTTRAVQFFVAEPKEVVFTDYQVGNTYQMTVDIRNVSGSSRQMRIIPLNSSFFTITRGESSHPEGLIAPGMHVSCTITFTPTSLCNYQEEIKVQSHNGHCVIIPVMAVRPPPCLSLPENIECGSCLAGSVREITLQVENTGGEGRFTITHTNTPQPEGELQIGPFSLSPTEFIIPHSGSTVLQVKFSPGREGKYGEHFTMDCDNGQTFPLSLTGSADVVSMGCVYIGDSSSKEIAAFQIHDSAGDEDQSNQTLDPVIIRDDYELYTDRLDDECSVLFDNVNPHTSSYKTIVIRNYSNVDLPFSWRLFKPLTEASSSEKDTLVSSLVSSPSSPFSVFPSTGTLSAGSNHSFLCQFLPLKSGEFYDAAHLVVPCVPLASLDSTSEGETWTRVSEDGDTNSTAVSCVCIFFTAVAEPHVVELQPPAILLPAPIPLATDTRQRIKMVSHSVSRLQYTWRQLPSQEGITIIPASGFIVPGGGAYCEVVIQRLEEGEFSLYLICDIQHSPHPVTLPLHGWTQGPQVSVDCASLQFGLVPLGTSSQLSLSLTSHTNTAVTVEMRQYIRHFAAVTEEGNDEEIITDHDCLHFTPSTLTLPPHAGTTFTVECRPQVVGRLRSIVQCVVNGKVIRCIAVHAEAQHPVVTLAQCRLHEETVYVAVEIQRTVEITNISLIPTHFTWSEQVQGSSSGHCSISISPLSGEISPRQTLPITITATWDSVGTHPETVLCCNVEGMRESLLLVLSAEVHGLAVSYSVQENRNSTTDDDLCLDFGAGDSLFTPQTLHLMVTNTTAIPAHLTTHIRHFPPSPISPPHNQNNKPQNTGQKRSILSRTVNIGDANSKTSRQANRDYVHGLLKEGRGCCFVVDPPSLPLLPFTTHTLTITAYSDMWGDYHDTLTCQVSGLESVEVPIHCSITGCPLLFHSTAQAQHSLIRFGSHSVGAPPVQRIVRINNTAPEEIRLDWQVYNILEEDNNVIDVITTIGPHFPNHTHSLTNTSPHSHVDEKSEHSNTSGGMEPGQSDASVGTEPGHSDKSIDDGDSVVRVFLRGHEGTPANKPFSIHPTQMVIPARGQRAVTLTFHPSLDLSSSLSTYCLGYISLDHQSMCHHHVHRETGYELTPLRLDLEACVEQPQLHMEADADHGLHFSYPASILLHREHVLSEVSRTHHMTLINLTSSSLSFTLSCSSPYFTITPSTPSPTYTLTPHKAISVGVVFHLRPENLKGCTTNKLTYSDSLIVNFSTGGKQEFQLSAEVEIPHISLSIQHLDLGVCLLDHSLSSSLTLYNTSSSELPWCLEPSPGLCEVVSVNPMSGVMPSHMNTTRPSCQHIHLTFTPHVEDDYSDTIVAREVLTGCEIQVTVNASATTDEVYQINN